MMIRACTRMKERKTCIIIEFNICALFCHLRASYVRVRARIFMKISVLIDRYTDSLSLKFYEDPFIGCGEIAETKLSMHYSHFLNVFLDIFQI